VQLVAARDRRAGVGSRAERRRVGFFAAAVIGFAHLIAHRGAPEAAGETAVRIATVAGGATIVGSRAGTGIIGTSHKKGRPRVRAGRVGTGKTAQRSALERLAAGPKHVCWGGSRQWRREKEKARVGRSLHRTYRTFVNGSRPGVNPSVRGSRQIFETSRASWSPRRFARGAARTLGNETPYRVDRR